MKQTEYSYPHLKKLGQPTSFFSYALLRDILLPNLMGEDTDAMLYWAGKELARQFPLAFIEDIPAFFADANWGELILIKEKKNQIIFHLQGESPTLRIETMNHPSFDLEAGFLAEQVQQINEEYSETSIEFKLDKGYILLVVHSDPKETLHPEELKMEGKISLYSPSIEHEHKGTIAMEKQVTRTDSSVSNKSSDEALYEAPAATDRITNFSEKNEQIPTYQENFEIEKSDALQTKNQLFNDDDFDMWQADFGQQYHENNDNSSIPEQTEETETINDIGYDQIAARLADTTSRQNQQTSQEQDFFAEANKYMGNRIPSYSKEEIMQDHEAELAADKQATRVQGALLEIRNASKESAFSKLFEGEPFEDKTKEAVVENAFSMIHDFDRKLPPEPNLDEPLISETLPPRSTSHKRKKK